MNLSRLALVLALAWPGLAGAQVPNTFDAGTGMIDKDKVNANFRALTAGTAPFQAFNGWAPIFGLTYSAVGIPAAGTGHAVGDVLTLNDGCATHGQLTVTAITGSAISAATIVAPGVCSVLPNQPVGTLSTSGSGTGATFTLNYAPYASGIVNAPNDTGGNTFIATFAAPGFAGQEAVLVGNNAGTKFTGISNFDVAMGISACGGGGGTPFVSSSLTCIGTDAGRNVSTGIARTVIIGTGAGENIVGPDNTILGSNAAATALTSGIQNTISGGASAPTLVSGSGNFIGGFKTDVTLAAASNSVIIGAQSAGGAVGSRCPGASVCVGSAVGNAAVTSAAGQHVLIGANVGQTNLAGGAGEILIGFNIDMPAGQGGSNSWRNIGNTWIGKNTLPTVSSGFGTSPTVAGASSAGFTVNVGTGGTASSGIVSVSSAPAPTGWACSAVDQTNAATANTVATPLSTTTITLTNYSRTTGIAAAWVASDVVVVSCNGY
jgi:hypothetical protein